MPPTSLREVCAGHGGGLEDGHTAADGHRCCGAAAPELTEAEYQAAVAEATQVRESWAGLCAHPYESELLSSAVTQ